MKPLRLLIAAAWAASSLAAQAADSLTPVTDGLWYSFFHADADSSWLNDYVFNDPGQQSFSLSGPAWLHVTEGGLAGDRFSVYDNGVLLGATSLVGADANADAGVNFDQAMGSAQWSHGSWLLGAGEHVITGLTLASPYGAGVGALQITPVPEPAGYAMLLAGLGMLGLIIRRRGKR